MVVKEGSHLSYWIFLALYELGRAFFQCLRKFLSQPILSFTFLFYWSEMEFLFRFWSMWLNKIGCGDLAKNCLWSYEFSG